MSTADFVPVEITLRNYRAFEDQAPARFRLGPGMTAFVGPNNGGKSTLLRWMHEMRNHLRRWGASSPVGHQIPSLEAMPPEAWELLDVSDPDEIASDQNDRPVEIAFDWPHFAHDSPEPELCPDAVHPIRRVLLVGDQRSRTWSVRGFAGDNHARVERRNLAGGTSELVVLGREQGGRDRAVDAERWRACCAALGASLYVGPYRNVITTGAAAYYDLPIGTAFVKQWDEWKAGGNRARAQAAQRVVRDVRRIFGYTHLDVSASPDGTELQVTVDDRPFRLREHGAGLAQFLIVLTAAAMREPAFVLVDEPELHLHPALQAEFLRALASYATVGTVFATHSLGLARTMAEHLYVVRREDGRASVRPFGGATHYAELLGELGFGAYQELGGARVLLVEGVTEVKALQEVLRAYGKESTTVVLPLGGRQLITANRQIELAELRRLTMDSRSSSTASVPRPARRWSRGGRRSSPTVRRSATGFT